jgi:hypothetical protein
MYKYALDPKVAFLLVASGKAERRSKEQKR